jgi:hypothetical protein
MSTTDIFVAFAAFTFMRIKTTTPLPALEQAPYNGFSSRCRSYGADIFDFRIVTTIY